MVCGSLNNKYHRTYRGWIIALSLGWNWADMNHMGISILGSIDIANETLSKDMFFGNSDKIYIWAK